MKYYEVFFSVSPLSQDACDVVAALAGEAGFESFEDCDGGLRGYVQQQLFDEPTLRSLLNSCPLPGVTVSYTVSEAEDRNWNAEWEQQGFEPILVKEGQKELLIHDGRHLPTQTTPISIEIDTHQAFGTGNHETTRMMCSALLNLNLDGCRMLDCGTGTGILAIAALKLGAACAVGYDIDEWAVDNARHNAVINGVDNRFTSLLGDATLLKTLNSLTPESKVEGTFDIVTANINRNILLADMPAFVSKMTPGGTLLLSGFYTDDIPMLVERATELGLTLKSQREDNNWACVAFAN